MKHSSLLIAVFALFASTAVACGGTGATSSSTESGGGSSSAGSGSSPAGSGSSSAGSGGGGTPLSPEAQMAKFCSDTVAPFCEALFACCTVQGTLTKYGGSLDACKMKETAECEYITPPLVDFIKAGKTSLDEAQLAAYASTLNAMKAGGAACVRPPIFAKRDCFGAFKGKLAPGAACDELGYYDNITCDKGYCYMGQCVPFLPLGAACSQPASFVGGCDWVQGEFCVNGGSKCAPLGKVGDPACEVGVPPPATCYSMSCDIMNLKCAPPDMYTLCLGI